MSASEDKAVPLLSAEMAERFAPSPSVQPLYSCMAAIADGRAVVVPAVTREQIKAAMIVLPADAFTWEEDPAYTLDTIIAALNELAPGLVK